MREYHVGMELTDEQIELVVGLAQRVLAASERGNVRSDWEDIKQRIEGAVERGDITREEADAKKMEIKKHGKARRGEGREVDRDGIKERIEGAVERGDITREEADAKYKEIKERIAQNDDGGAE